LYLSFLFFVFIYIILVYVINNIINNIINDIINDIINIIIKYKYSINKKMVKANTVILYSIIILMILGLLSCNISKIYNYFFSYNKILLVNDNFYDINSTGIEYQNYCTNNRSLCPNQHPQVAAQCPEKKEINLNKDELLDVYSYLYLQLLLGKITNTEASQFHKLHDL
jgi:hypothetical protein